MRCRAGTAPSSTVSCGPSSAERHFAPHRARDKIENDSIPASILLTRCLPLSWGRGLPRRAILFRKLNQRLPVSRRHRGLTPRQL